jgi:UDP-N-acetylmuramoyl-tripeptide--D-alanyl-D-alanine ligase
MGTYGPGEIADLCRWCPPDISVITAIGPVHLERFGDEDHIVLAKSEILVTATTVVLQVDDPRLATVADRAEAAGKRVLRCSGRAPAGASAPVEGTAPPAGPTGGVDVRVVRTADGRRITATVEGAAIATDVPLPTGLQPSNLACAIAVALAVGIDRTTIASRLADLRAADHRLQAVPSASGAVILDDTYNSNPTGAAEALAALVATADGMAGDPRTAGRRVVVTPGMVELGSRQFVENQRFGAAIASVATDLVVVGLTNRRALLAGVDGSDRATAGSDRATAGSPGPGRGDQPGADPKDQDRRTVPLRVQCLSDRPQAVEWVRSQLGPADVVLYENDLPDHYP